MENKKEIKISEILRFLDKGMEREEIRLELGLSKKELKVVFEHPLLKGRRRKEAVNIILIDDTSSEAQVIADIQIEAESENLPETESEGTTQECGGSISEGPRTLSQAIAEDRTMSDERQAPAPSEVTDSVPAGAMSWDN